MSHRRAGFPALYRHHGVPAGPECRGVTVVMITHDMHLMLEYTRRALVFCDGRLIADRTAAAVLCDPALVEQAA